MPRTIAQHLKLFETDVSASVLTEMLDPERFESFAHTTRLPGGFFTCQIVVPSTEARYWDWREQRWLHRLLIEESTGKQIWQGRLEDITLDDFWKTRLTFFGYWSNFTDSVQNADYDTTGDAIVQAVRDNIHADSDQLSTSNAEMDTGPTIDNDYQADWNGWRILTDRNRGVTSFGGTNTKKMDVAVWDDRVVHYKERNPAAVTWQSFIKPENGGGVAELPSRISWRTLSNAVLTVYESTGTVTRTAYSTDATSIARWIRREKHVENIGESDATAAGVRRDVELEATKDPQQETDGLTLTRVWDTSGVEWPLCRVRAGDVLRISDFTPQTSDLDSLTLDAFRTFFIEETECSHPSGLLKIRPDRDGVSLDDLLARNNIK